MKVVGSTLLTFLDEHLQQNETKARVFVEALKALALKASCMWSKTMDMHLNRYDYLIMRKICHRRFKIILVTN